MKALFSKRIIITVILLILFVVGGYFFLFKSKEKVVEAPSIDTAVKTEVLGRSVQGRVIEAYTFGGGDTLLGLVGGIHGGYEWNSVMLSYELIDYLTANPQIIPANIKVVVIPVANPDGLFQVINKEGRFSINDVKSDLPNGTGRFNANNVDLNRNFACDWQATSTWKGNIVSAGTAVFSEPEARTIRDFVLQNKPKAMIFFHSMSNAIYASACGNGILPETRNIMLAYSKASGYPAVDTFDSYAITGAVEDWLASVNIPAITVELSTHEAVEWDKNLAGVKALFNYFSSSNQVR